MFDSIEKVTRVVIQPTRNLRLRLHAKLLQEREGRKENFHSLYRKETGEGYLTLDVQSFLTLEIIDREEWDKSKSILIDQRNIFQIINGFDKCLKAIYNERIFDTRENGDIYAYRDMVDKHTVNLFHLGANGRMVLRPAVIYDSNEVTYEGVALHINKTANVAELPIDAFEALYYALKQVNLFVYSQLMLNYFIASMREDKIELREVKRETKTKKNNKQHPLFHRPTEEMVVNRGVTNETPEEFFGIEKQQ